MENNVVVKKNDPLIKPEQLELIKERLSFIRPDLNDNSYIKEALKVLPVGGFRSAIGQFWNAVVDDLRNKIIYRSLPLFNKELNLGREIKRYEDFQDYVNDDQLIEGAYKIGIIGWEANKILRHAKETRHIFDGHPASTDPSPIKVLGMIEDCVKYVLSQEYPPQIVDIDEYINVMGTSAFDRNEYSVPNTISDLPAQYKEELINRFFSAYIDDSCSTILRSNIEFVSPILWKVLPKNCTVQICHRVDKEITKSNLSSIEHSFRFIGIVNAKKYLTINARRYLLSPIIKSLNQNLDQWDIENGCVNSLSSYAGYIPHELINDYVNGITQTYIGRIGSSIQFSRTDFYADQAASKIPGMFEKFDDETVSIFIEVIKNNSILKERIRSNEKLNRLRTLANITYKRISESFTERVFLEALIDEKKEKKFFNLIR